MVHHGAAPRELDVALDLDEPEGALPDRVAALLGVPPGTLGLTLVRRSLDTRKGRRPRVRYRVRATAGGEATRGGLALALPELSDWPAAIRATGDLRVVVVGSGPAGSFAALRLGQAGARVTVVEQGRPLSERRRDVARLLRQGAVDPASNFCFGEGGAGTFSDGKLYTRAKDREAVAAVLGTFVRLGADPEILVESRPHVGSNRLPRVLAAMRQRLESLGVGYRWSDRVVDLEAREGRVVGVRLASGSSLDATAVVLACGHSARPLYETLASRGVALTPKPFAMGVRLEHPQALIDELQYGRYAGHPRLPPAFYQVSTQVGARGVYSFCMCPGGWIVPSSTEADGLCVNGMSMAKRNAPFANAALVVAVAPPDFLDEASRGGAVSTTLAHSPLGGVALQRLVERAAWELGGGGHCAPAQRARDFVRGRVSSSLPRSSYRPGVVAADLAAALPSFVVAALRQGLLDLDRRLPGFLAADALLVGVETRTSAPVRIERHRETLESPTHPGLYPAGEGSGHAGGIVSSAIDGVRVADAILTRRG